MPARERGEVLSDLVDMRRVFVKEVETGGRRTSRYISAKYASQQL
jgi:hypothetical protein